MSIGQRIGAGVFAGFGAAGGALGALPAKESYNNQVNEDIPAIVQEAPESAAPGSYEDIAREHSGDRFTAQVPEEYQEQKPDISQNLGELGDNMQNLASAGAEAAEAKEKAAEANNNSSASRSPEYGDHPDMAAPKTPEQEAAPAREPSPEAGNDYSNDYGISM